MRNTDSARPTCPDTRAAARRVGNILTSMRRAHRPQKKSSFARETLTFPSSCGDDHAVPLWCRGPDPERVIMACRTLIHGGVRFRERKGRDLNIKLLVILIGHLVGAMHRAKWSRE